MPGRCPGSDRVQSVSLSSPSSTMPRCRWTKSSSRRPSAVGSQPTPPHSGHSMPPPWSSDAILPEPQHIQHLVSSSGRLILTIPFGLHPLIRREPFQGRGNDRSRSQRHRSAPSGRGRRSLPARVLRRKPFILTGGIEMMKSKKTIWPGTGLRCRKRLPPRAGSFARHLRIPHGRASWETE